MKVIHINQSDYIGGAARAAYRIHWSLRDIGVDSCMWVNRATLGDWTVKGASSKKELALNLIRPSLVLPLKRLARTNNAPHSINILPSNWVNKINQSDADVINLHWINGEMISIKEISRITKPIVWTLHDMWAFCGAEHYTEHERWREGYTRFNKVDEGFSFDLNRFVWREKRRYWKEPLNIISPSIWLAECVKHSALMQGWPVQFIPNPIDSHKWNCIDKAAARNILNLPRNKSLILFGAIGGASDPRKGFDLLEESLKVLRLNKDLVNRIELVIFGQLPPKQYPDLGFEMHFLGHLHDDPSLNLVYSACDVFVLPSRQDNCPLTVIESQASGTPVIAYDNTGAPSIIEHKKTGYLARAFDAIDFANGILWAIDNAKDLNPQEIALFAKNSFGADKVAKQYNDFYKDILSKRRKSS